MIEPLSTPVPSKVLKTEPLTISVLSVENDSDMNPNDVIWADDETIPLGNCSEPLITPSGNKIITCWEPDTIPLGIFCRLVDQSAPAPPAEIPVILESTDELNVEKVEPLINPWGSCSEPLIIPLGIPLNSSHDDAPPPLPVGIVIVLPLEIVSWSPTIDRVCESEPLSSVAEFMIVYVPPTSSIVIPVPPIKLGVPCISVYLTPYMGPEEEIADAVILPKMEFEPVAINEPETLNSPSTTEAVTTPCICLLWIKVAIIYLLSFLLQQNQY